MDDPPGTTGDLGTDHGRQGKANKRGPRKRKQACGAEHRYERRRLAGGGWEKSIGGQLSMPVEDVGSG